MNEQEMCGYGCGRKWDAEGDFKDCVSAYHNPEKQITTWSQKAIDSRGTTSGLGLSNCFDSPAPKSIRETFFIYEHIEKMEEVRKHIQECEGKHTQQAIYSTFHDALTQICFGCKKVRSTIKR